MIDINTLLWVPTPEILRNSILLSVLADRLKDYNLLTL